MAFTFGQFAAVVAVGGLGSFLLGCAFALHPMTRPPLYDVDPRDVARLCMAFGVVCMFVVIAPVIVRWFVG